MWAVDFSVCEGYLNWLGLINLHPPVAEPRCKHIEVSLEGLGGDVRILVTGHDSSIVRKSGKDGVLKNKRCHDISVHNKENLVLKIRVLQIKNNKFRL